MKAPGAFVSVLTFRCTSPGCQVAAISILAYHDRSEPPPLKMYCTACKAGTPHYGRRTVPMQEISEQAAILAAEAAQATEEGS